MALKPPKTADLVACSDLVLDFTIYPRSSVDATTVSQYVLALQAGEQFPPIIVDRKTKRVVDGFHRVKAYIMAHGDEAKIPVIWRDFKDETEMHRVSIAMNTRHGKTLSPFDRARCIKILVDLGVAEKDIADDLGMKPSAMLEFFTKRAAKCGKDEMVLKRTNIHLAGTKLSTKQGIGNARCSGMTQVFYVNQVINLIENDLLDPANKMLKERLSHLAGLLEDYRG